MSQRLLFEILMRKKTNISQHRHILDALVLADTEKIRSLFLAILLPDILKLLFFTQNCKMSVLLQVS